MLSTTWILIRAIEFIQSKLENKYQYDVIIMPVDDQVLMNYTSHIHLIFCNNFLEQIQMIDQLHLHFITLSYHRGGVTKIQMIPRY